MSNTNENQNHAPLKACFFAEANNVEFEETAEAKDNKFKIVAYSGQVIKNHWYWGNVAFDLEGLSFDKDKTPVLDFHAFGNRIGFTTKQEITNKVAVEGNFLSNEKAQELRTDMKDGFPMQASIYIPPSIIEQVKEGESIKVNGHTLDGPGAVFRKATIKDVVICIFGYDSHTSSEAFAEGGKQEIQFNVLSKENEMTKESKLELTAETFAVEYPELFEAVTAKAKAEGEKENRALFAEFAEKFGDDPAFCLEQFKAGITLNAATEAQNVKMKKDKEQAAEQARADADPAPQEFSDEQKKAADEEQNKDGKPATFDAAVKDRMDKTNCSHADAIRFCVREYPKLHEKYKEEHTSNR